MVRVESLASGWESKVKTTRTPWRWRRAISATTPEADAMASIRSISGLMGSLPFLSMAAVSMQLA